MFCGGCSENLGESTVIKLITRVVCVQMCVMEFECDEFSMTITLKHRFLVLTYYVNSKANF